MTLFRSTTLLVQSEQRLGRLHVEVSGTAPDPEIGCFRQFVAAAILGRGEPLVFDLTDLRDWEHEAQASLLHTVREQRHAGRTVTVEGLRGLAAQRAERSGMSALLLAPAEVPSKLPSLPRENHDAQLTGRTSTLDRIAQDRQDRQERRPTAQRVCSQGHPVLPSAAACDRGHALNTAEPHATGR